MVEVMTGIDCVMVIYWIAPFFVSVIVTTGSMLVRYTVEILYRVVGTAIDMVSVVAWVLVKVTGEAADSDALDLEADVEASFVVPDETSCPDVIQ